MRITSPLAAYLHIERLVNRLKSSLAGLGVAGLIVISLVLLLLVAGAVTSFSGWSSRQGGAKSRDLVVRVAPVPDMNVGVVDRARRPARARPRRAPRAPRRAAAKPPVKDRATSIVRAAPRSRRPPPVVVRPGPVRPAPKAPATVTRPVARTPSGPVDQAPPLGGPQPAGPIPSLDGVPGGFGAVTERLTDDLGTAIEPVSPVAGNVVSETGKTTADLVSGLGAKRR